MADEEVSSLLLKVGVDFAAVEEFVAALPIVVEVAAAVGQQLNALEIGNVDVFRSKGAALSRALVAGFQAEALGLSFGGQDIAGVITERVFGRLDPALGARYVADVQKVIDGIRFKLPELGAPLINQQALSALSSVGGLAAQGRRELEGMSQQLDGVLARLAAISQVRLPQRLVERTPEGTFAPTATARRAAETLGLSLRDTVQPALRPTGARGFGPDVPSLAGTSAGLGRLLGGAQRDQIAALEREQQAIQRSFTSRVLSAAAAAAPPTTVTLFRGENPDAASSRRPGQGGDLRGRFFAEDIRTAQEYAGALGKVVQVTVSATEAENARARAIKNRVLEGFVLDPETAARARSVGQARPALPAGVGNGPASAVDQDRLTRAVEAAARRSLRQADALESAGRGVGSGQLGSLSLSPTTGIASFTRTPNVLPSFSGPTQPEPKVSTAEATALARRTNESILRALDVRTQKEGFTGFTAELNPDALRKILGPAAYENLITGKGIGPAVQTRLTEEQRDALGSNDARRPKGTLFPPNLIDVERARQLLVDQRTDPNAKSPFVLESPAVQAARNAALAEIGQIGRSFGQAQRAITATGVNPAFAPVPVRSRVDQLELEARAAANVRARAGVASLPAASLPASRVEFAYSGIKTAGAGSEFSPDRAYRVLGRAGYEALLRDGALTAKPGSQYGSELFFNRGTPLAKYARRQEQIVAEVDARLLATSGNGFPVGQSGQIPAQAVRVLNIDRKTGEVTELPNRPEPPKLTRGGVPAAAAAAAGVPAAGVDLGFLTSTAERLRGAANRVASLPPEQLAQLNKATGIDQAVASEQRAIRAEQALAAATQTLASSRVQAAVATSRQVFVAGPQGVSRATLEQAQGRQAIVPTISNEENARRRQALIEDSRRQAEDRFQARRTRGLGLGDDRQQSQRPGSSFGPQPEEGAARFRRLERERVRAGFDNDIFDRAGNPVPGNAGGGQGGRGGGGGFPAPGPLGSPGAGGAPGNPGGVRGPVGSFLGGLKRGALGDGSDTPDFLGKSIGSALRFSLVYGAAYSALRLFTGAFSEGVNGAIAYETALANLNLATERTGRSNEKLAISLSNAAASRGFSGDEGVNAGARAIGLFDATDAPAGQQAAIAQTSTKVAAQIAFISGQTLEQVQTQIAGITRSFNIDALDQGRVADVASFLGRRSGRPGGEILQSLGQIGSLGESAGFSLEQVGAIITRLTSTTGQTPQAVSGFLSQVLSKADDPNVKSTLRGLGIDTSGTLADQIDQLSKANLSRGQRNQVVQAFGRGRSGQALGIILDQKTQIDELATGAKNDSAGLAEKDFNVIARTVGGQLRILGTELKDLFTGIAESGLLDVFVLLLGATRGVVESLNFVVDTFNSIPRPVRTAAFALAELYAAALLLTKLPRVAAFTNVAAAAAGSARTGGLFAALFGGEAARAAARTGRPASAVFGPLTAEAAAQGGGRAEAGVVAGLIAAQGGGLAGAARVPFAALGGTSLGSAVGGAASVGAIGAGLILAAGAAAVVGIVGALKSASEASAVTRKIDNAGVAVNAANSDSEISNARRLAQEGLKAAKERDDFKLLSKDSLTLGVANIVDDVRGGSKEQAARAQAQLDRLDKDDKARKLAQQSDTASAFGGLESVDQVTQGIQELSEKGVTAAERIRLLNQAFDGLVVKADASAGAVGVIFAGQGDAFARAIASASFKAGDGSAKALNASAISLDSGRASDGVVRTLARSTRSLLESNPITGLLAGIINVPAGALGRAAGGNGLGGKLGGFFAGAGSQISQDIKETNPFSKSDAEKASAAANAAKKINADLADPKLQDKLRTGVLDTLVGLGKDPALGAVTLTEADKKVIAEKQLDILKKSLGKDFDSLTKEQKKAFTEGISASVGAAVGDFNGTDITAANASAFLSGLRADAGKAGQDATLTTGSAVQGAQLTQRTLEGGRSRIQAQIAKDQARLGVLDDAANAAAEGPARAAILEAQKAERQALTGDSTALGALLGQLGLDVQSAEAATSQQLIARAQALGDLAKSGLLTGDVRGANNIDLSTINQSLALPGLDENTRSGLEAQRANLTKKDEQDALATRAAAALNKLPIRGERARLVTQIDSARAELATVAPDSLQAQQLIGQIAAFQDQLVQYALGLAAASDQLVLDSRGNALGLKFNPNDSAGQNRLAQTAAANALANAQATGDPKAIREAQVAKFKTDFQANVTDPIALQNSKNQAGSSGSGFQDANVALVNARNDLTGLAQGSAEYFAKQAEINKLTRDLASQQEAGFASFLLDQVRPGDSLGAARAAATVARRQADLAKQQFGGGSTEFRTANQNADQAEFAQRQAELSTRQALRLSRVNPGDDIGNAKAAVDNAKDALAFAQRIGTNTQEFFAAQRALAEAQLALGTKQREAAQRAARLKTDLTDPVAQAVQSVKDAQANLAAAKATGGDTTQSQLDLRNAQNNAESAAFQQRFTDAQTADDLGRISHTKYLSYLNNEHDRLSAITNRTRQQQDELDQVDKAIKSANEQLSGQFNLGDIKVPTPFEVRRSLVAGGGGPTTSTNSVNTTVSINGADLVQVKALLVQLIGPQASNRAPVAAARKVR